MFCGIDVGTQGVRAVVVDGDGVVRGSAATSMPAGGRSGREHVQAPSDWWDALVASVRGALQAAADASSSAVEIDAIALDATSGTVLLERADGSVSGDALMYDDGRAVEQAAIAQRVGASLWDALGYRMQPSWALPKAMWLSEHGAAQSDERIVHQSDHLVGRLAGHPVATDVSNALKTGVDLRDATWPQELHAELGLRSGLLPDVVLPGAWLAEVGAHAAAATGLRAGTPIRAGMTDGCAAQIAAGALAPGQWSSALGTTLVIKGSTADLVRDPAGAVYCHRHPDGGWLPGGASSTGAGVIAGAFPDLDSAGLTGLTARAAAFAVRDTLVYPLAGRGERFPFVAPEAHGFAPAGLDDAERFAALCRGIAYIERLSYDVLAGLGADVSGTVSLTGGASANGWWNQLRTDVLGRPTLRPVSTEAAFGMAVLAAADTGELTTTAHAMVHVAERLEPDPERGEELREGYRALVADLADRGWLSRDTASCVLTVTGGVR